MGKKTIFWSVGILLGVRVLLAVLTPVFDTSEARYAVISANMARTGDFLVPHFTHRGVYQSFDGKPPLLFQAGGACCQALGVSAFAVRLPVLIASAVLLCLLWRVVLILSDGNRRTAGLAVGLAASSTAFYALAGFCMTDGLLVLCVAGALLCHAALVQTGNRNWSLGVFALLGLGMIVKGPVALVEFGLGAFLDLCVNRRWPVLRRYRWFSGVVLFLAIAAPWFVLMARANPGFLRYFFVNENLLRFLVHDYGDKYGSGRETFRGMAAVWTLVVTLPWTPVWLGRLWRNCAWARPGRNPAATAVLGWGVVGMTAFWCLTSRVPLAYLIPVVPLFAGWLALSGTEAERRTCLRFLPAASGASALVLTAALVGTMLCSDKMGGADAPYHPKRYSYEFYHGRLPVGEVAR
ncbi:MAG: ArnT family glycosyltransferase [Kiritimatiellia bacterium]